MYEYQTDESEELKILKRNILQPSLSNYLTLDTDHRTGREVTSIPDQGPDKMSDKMSITKYCDSLTQWNNKTSVCKDFIQG